MKLFYTLIQYFLLTYFCFGHDLHHTDQDIVKQSESTIANDLSNKTIEITNSPKTNIEDLHNPIDVRFQAIHDLKNSIYESSQNDNEEQIQSTTLSLQNQPSIINENDLISSSTLQTNEQLKLSTIETLISTDTIKQIPISNDKLNPKIIHKDDLSSNQQEQIKSISNTQSSISHTINNSNLSDKNLQIPIINNISIVEDDIHIPVSTTSKFHQNIHLHSQQENENISITGSKYIIF
ncbi:unnamed protein product [Rotaria sp. Silwood1]|nr:unnamed protein product [Rotaria sp. Silwood1]CAF4790197.1 unnamed protein product [Rotaria sp. Silwood1]